MTHAELDSRYNALRRALARIQAYSVELICDAEADPNDESPPDMVAHLFGLIWQECEKALNGGTNA